MDTAIGKESTVYIRSCDAWMLGNHKADLVFQALVELPAFAFIAPALWEQAFKTVFFVVAVPFLDGGGSYRGRFSVRPRIGLCSGLSEEFIIAYGWITGSGFERCDNAIAKQCDFLLFVKSHGVHHLSLTVRP